MITSFPLTCPNRIGDISTQDLLSRPQSQLSSISTLSFSLHLKVPPTAEDFGQLVVLGFDVTVFTPAPYQRRSLRRPSMESSS